MLPTSQQKEQARAKATFFDIIICCCCYCYYYTSYLSLRLLRIVSMHSYRLSGRDGCMLRNSNTVIGRTVNAKSNKFAFSPSQSRQYLFLATSTAVLPREAFSSHPVTLHLLKTCHFVHRNRKVSSLLILLGSGERVQISKILDRQSRCLWLHGALLIHDSCSPSAGTSVVSLNHMFSFAAQSDVCSFKAV